MLCVLSYGINSVLLSSVSFFLLLFCVCVCVYQKKRLSIFKAVNLRGTSECHLKANRTPTPKSEDDVWQPSISTEKRLQRVSWSSFTYKRLMKSSLGYINFSDVLRGAASGIPQWKTNTASSLFSCGCWEEPSRYPSQFWVWSEFVAEKMKCYFLLARKLKGSLLYGTEVGVLDAIMIVGLTQNDAGGGANNDTRVRFCQISKKGQPIGSSAAWRLHLKFPCHWLICCISVRCISLHRFLFRLALITARVKLWIDLRMDREFRLAKVDLLFEWDVTCAFKMMDLVPFSTVNTSNMVFAW